jgi:putative transposase
VIRNSEDLYRHMDYIHYNPVKHGYASKPLGYKWSSFNTHVDMGNYNAEWGADSVSKAIHAMDLE